MWDLLNPIGIDDTVELCGWSDGKGERSVGGGEEIAPVGLQVGSVLDEISTGAAGPVQLDGGAVGGGGDFAEGECRDRSGGWVGTVVGKRGIVGEDDGSVGGDIVEPDVIDEKIPTVRTGGDESKPYMALRLKR